MQALGELQEVAIFEERELELTDSWTRAPAVEVVRA
jgi:hypothetical protein